MLNNFLIFVAPFLICIGALFLAFWAAMNDNSLSKK
ncbi:cytochrome bd oxidase small subunit CydS [Oceanobacillus sp. FSL W7-1309]